MDYIEISNANHDKHIGEITTFIMNPTKNSTISNFIEKIIKYNKNEYLLLCNALFSYINTQSVKTPQQSSSSSISNRLKEKITKISAPFKIPYKNKLLIDKQFKLNDESEDIKYKYYLSFYIIYAINNTTDPSSD